MNSGAYDIDLYHTWYMHTHTHPHTMTVAETYVCACTPAKIMLVFVIFFNMYIVIACMS